MAEVNTPGNHETPQPESPKKEDVIADYYSGMKEMEMQGHESGIRKARNALFVTGALVFAGELIGASVQNIPLTTLIIGIALIEGGIFVGLGFWTKKKPFTAIITGIILYLGLWVLTIALVGGEAAYKGIIVKIIILSYLFSALKPAREWERLKKENGQ